MTFNIFKCVLFHSFKYLGKTVYLILKYLCQPANLFLTRPIGLGPIEYKDNKIKNIDLTHLISSHMEYKNKFNNILDIISVS